MKLEIIVYLTKITVSQYVFLGRDKGRLQIINELADRLTTLGCKLDFNVVKDKTSSPTSKYLIENKYRMKRILEEH